jgi:D-inositol-3-phosphate glycosyltransferase
MKILQISFHTAPFGNIGKNDSGGLNVYVENISKQLSKNNTVVVVTAEEAKSFKKDNLEFRSFNLFNQDLSTEDKESYLQEFIDKLFDSLDLNSFDVIHAHYWLSGLIGRDLASKLNKPLIYTSHSFGVFLDGYNKERVDCEKLIMLSANAVTSSSKFEEEVILENYIVDSTKIKQITPGVDNEIFSPDLSLNRENIFLSIGRIQEQKGQIETIKFLDNFRKVENNFQCYFVGGPSGKTGHAYLENLKQTVSELNLDSHIDFLGNLSQEKVRDLLNKSKLLIHTSKLETFGLVAIEANAMGVPVLTNNNGSLLEIIDNNKNGLYSENLLDGSVNYFVQDLLNNNFDENMQNCIEKSKKYSWKNTLNDLEALYKLFS